MIQPTVIIVDEIETFPQVAASWIADKVSEIISSTGRCKLALAGGETPRPVYELLTRSDLSQRVEWDKMEFYFGDERCVPPEHSDSNYRMAHESLLSKVPIAQGQICRISAEHPDRDQAAADYEAGLPRPLDLILLGMGRDGHTASLFPGSPALDEQHRRVLVVERSKPPSWRITVTPPVIADARSVLVMVCGKHKAPMVARALRGSYTPREIPIQLALRGTWIIDARAAGDLRKARS